MATKLLATTSAPDFPFTFKAKWLKSLGLVLIDYNDLTMKFIHDGKIIKLKGNLDTNPHAITPP